MVKTFQRIAFLFPGQGSQYLGMAQDFIQNFSAARLTFEEGDDLLGRSLSKIILEGPEKDLTETKNSQTGIYVASMAILRVVQELYDLKPFVCAGLSLGEYTALTATDWISFRQGLPLVNLRGQFMNEACESFPGTMVVLMGLDTSTVEEIVREINLPNDLWIANFNCPGQVVLSGTFKGIEAASAAAKTHHAKRIIPLQVHGAFHSGLMQKAQEKLTPYLQEAAIVKGSSQLVMNVPGDFVSDVEKVRQNLIEQVTHSVCWEQGIRAMDRENVDLYIEFGPGKTLSGMIKRIGLKTPILSIENVSDLDHLSNLRKKENCNEEFIA
jgi:[acyl-carrier-protein] S-malonyltransferase